MKRSGTIYFQCQKNRFHWCTHWRLFSIEGNLLARSLLFILLFFIALDSWLFFYAEVTTTVSVAVASETRTSVLGPNRDLSNELVSDLSASSSALEIAPLSAPILHTPSPSPASVSELSVSFYFPLASFKALTTKFSRGHPGIDLSSKTGTAVYAVTSGTVTTAGWESGGFGRAIRIQSSDGIHSLYAHLSAIFVSTGQHVNQGDLIGTVGCSGRCTGAHLHLEIMKQGVAVDPLSYLRP